ncbi:malate synthase A [bacterium (Candidatus Blackallbacteria) CG17_big_fil_post_rev_8_21_14_2_50_48_46]|uniref:Malate synthase n=1 Tax=bacterium (Candidatus Blackallbacteria) CG17_big_fil_post_rev_8_21_14_2_50_48_46 TaxID=2014261 RepID=A0A2M7G5C0_9BACT|nr:MAG: malate synthase A [bacterium (Candidatus Blackallbacteria) CG17_big_fil_post_rev_8_21_14_2_50_48_46]PIW47824.1 MAG: malate synthase A [bacterium (Candidatus Blackallbacteria) CG13_big_fil_rev_8_21_14_2_50_49_14]
MKTQVLPAGLELLATPPETHWPVLSSEALEFITTLQREFNPRRQALLARRQERQKQLDAGLKPDFLPETQGIRSGDWKIAPLPTALQKRHLEITGPVDAKMVINALNSGADMFMADFEDASSPTWPHMLEGQSNLAEAIRGTLRYQSGEKSYQLNPQTAVLLVRPRGWHLPEKHLLVNGEPISASLFDFGLYFFHNAKELIARGLGPWFYLPKLESHQEAALWNDVFVRAQELLGIPQGTIKATVLIETILAAFEMDEILYVLREHIAGLNAGRWDYIFSLIKKFRNHPDAVLPDRAQITMQVPFMQAYCNLLVHTCHKRGAHAMGGMAAFIPSRRDPEITEKALAQVRADKEREIRQGFDGTWVAHPDLVPVAREAFAALAGEPHQKSVLRSEIEVKAQDLLNFKIPEGQISEAGFRLNINVALQYLAAWLQGQGAVAIHHLMEDAATAEISRAQLWQWLHRPEIRFSTGEPIHFIHYETCLAEELEKIQAQTAPQNHAALKAAAQVLNSLVQAEIFPEFLTLSAYQLL